MSVADKKRLQFDFRPDMIELLDKLVDGEGATSRAEIVKRALKFYSFFTEQTRNKGGFIMHVDDKDVQTKIVLI